MPSVTETAAGLEEPQAGARARRDSTLPRALGASLLLHACLLGLLARYAWVPVPPREEPPVPRIEARLAASNPQAIPLPEALPALEPEEAPPPLPEQPAQAETAPPPPAPELLPETGASAVAENPSPPPAVPAGRERGISRARLSESIAGFVTAYRSELNRNWLEECQRYRNAHGVTDCPQGGEGGYGVNPEEEEIAAGIFETYVDGHVKNARRARRFEEEARYLSGLMREDSELGELAAQRFYLVRDYSRYLAGLQGNGPLMNSDFTSAAGNISGGINLFTLITFGDGKLRLVGGLLSFGLEDGIGVNDTPPPGAARPFTEFEVERPERSPDGGQLPPFEIRPPLLRQR